MVWPKACASRARPQTPTRRRSASPRPGRAPTSRSPPPATEAAAGRRARRRPVPRAAGGEGMMHTRIEMFRRWFDYERDSHALVLAALEAVPAGRRGAPEFRKAATLLA